VRAKGRMIISFFLAAAILADRTTRSLWDAQRPPCCYRPRRFGWRRRQLSWACIGFPSGWTHLVGLRRACAWGANLFAIPRGADRRCLVDGCGAWFLVRLTVARRLADRALEPDSVSPRVLSTGALDTSYMHVVSHWVRTPCICGRSMMWSAIIIWRARGKLLLEIGPGVILSYFRPDDLCVLYASVSAAGFTGDQSVGRMLYRSEQSCLAPKLRCHRVRVEGTRAIVTRGG